MVNFKPSKMPFFLVFMRVLWYNYVVTRSI